MGGHGREKLDSNCYLTAGGKMVRASVVQQLSSTALNGDTLESNFFYDTG
jgi:hypothetical protein